MTRADAVWVDGSHGEGGGQILRSALALSMVTGRPLVIDKIRSRRKKPGLLRQHLTAVRAAAQICTARVQGAELASQRLVFEPGPVRAGCYHFRVGSAGSAVLVLQAVLPALLRLEARTEIAVEGGTHCPMAPPYEFLERSFLPLVARLGPVLTARLDGHGFYPAGGGRLVVEVTGCATLTPFSLLDGGEVQGRRALSVVSNLPERVGQRELNAVQAELGWTDRELELSRVDSPGPGNALMLSVARREVTEVFSAFGASGVRAEKVAANAIAQLRRHLGAEVPVGPYLADQLLLPLALAGRGAILTHTPTRHTLSNIEVIRRFVEVPISVAGVGERQATIRFAC